MNTKVLFAMMSIAVTLYGFMGYIRSIRQGQTKPHVFSWVIWGFLTVIVFLAQLSDGGGAGAWPTGVSGLLSMVVAVLAWIKKGDIAIKKMDWVCFCGGLAAIPFWLFMGDPMGAVILLTFINFIGFLPTIRKAYHAPFGEHLVLYKAVIVRNIFAIVALEHYSVTTLLHALFAVTSCLGFITMVYIKRRASFYKISV